MRNVFCSLKVDSRKFNVFGKLNIDKNLDYWSSSSRETAKMAGQRFSRWFHQRNFYNFPGINPGKDQKWKLHDHLIAVACFVKGWVLVGYFLLSERDYSPLSRNFTRSHFSYSYMFSQCGRLDIRYQFSGSVLAWKKFYRIFKWNYTWPELYKGKLAIFQSLELIKFLIQLI